MRGTELRQHHPQVKLIRWHTRRAPPPDSRAACGGNPRRARVRCNGGNALYGPRRPVRHRCARGNENAGSCNKPWHTGEVSLGLETGDSPGEALVIKISEGDFPHVPHESRSPHSLGPSDTGAVLAKRLSAAASMSTMAGGPLFLGPHRWTPIFLRTTRSGPMLTLLAPRTA